MQDFDRKAHSDRMHGSLTDWSMLLGRLFLLMNGGGRWSIDSILHKRMNQ